ncbi:hypothetical protein KKG48_00875 [Patescibacteria group bacterium]|nr:hypothetical protein [Patescibacteria group bacterium]
MSKLDPDFFRLVRDIPPAEIVSKLGLKIEHTFNPFSHLNFFCFCPFHREKRPSLLFYSNSSWRCHGCGEGGGPFRFVLLYLNGDSNKVIRWFHKNFGIPLPWK